MEIDSPGVLLYLFKVACWKIFNVLEIIQTSCQSVGPPVFNRTELDQFISAGCRLQRVYHFNHLKQFCCRDKLKMMSQWDLFNYRK